VVVDRPSVDAGLRFLAAGGDFADGAIAYEGRELGGEVFVTFDKGAARLVSAAGSRAELLPSKR
jgi:predicted nucleic-acid-binding protein